MKIFYLCPFQYYALQALISSLKKKRGATLNLPLLTPEYLS